MEFDEKTSSDQYEHVCLASEDKEEVTPTTIDAEIEQLHSGIRRHVLIFNGTYLGVTTIESRSRNDWHWINLAFLDPKPVRRLDRFWLIIAAICASLGAAAALVTSQIALSLPYMWAFAAAGAWLATLFVLGIAAHRYFHEFFFFTRNGRVPVLRLSQHKCGRNRVESFVEELGKAVHRALNERSVERFAYLCDEMKEHRRLLEQGVLLKKQFEVARASILLAHDR